VKQAVAVRTPSGCRPPRRCSLDVASGAPSPDQRACSIQDCSSQKYPIVTRRLARGEERARRDLVDDADVGGRCSQLSCDAVVSQVGVRLCTRGACDCLGVSAPLPIVCLDATTLCCCLLNIDRVTSVLCIHIERSFCFLSERLCLVAHSMPVRVVWPFVPVPYVDNTCNEWSGWFPKPTVAAFHRKQD